MSEELALTVMIFSIWVLQLLGIFMYDKFEQKGDKNENNLSNV